MHIYLYVEDVDPIFAQALAAGAKELMAHEDPFWGDRTGTLVDPFGHRWYVSTHKEDLRRRAERTGGAVFRGTLVNARHGAPRHRSS
jgi:hypothetical protein